MEILLVTRSKHDHQDVERKLLSADRLAHACTAWSALEPGKNQWKHQMAKEGIRRYGKQHLQLISHNDVPLSPRVNHLDSSLLKVVWQCWQAVGSEGRQELIGWAILWRRTARGAIE